MKRFLRVSGGYVRLCLTGQSPERFFNLCAASGLEIWDAVYEKGSYFFSMGIRDFKACRPYVRKAGVRVRIQRKKGLPFFLYRNRKRVPWAGGFLAFFLCMYLLSFFVWDISYQGNVRYTEDELNHFLDSLRVRSGMLKSRVSCEALEEALREEFQGITWVSARLSGTRLYIHVKENDVLLEIPVRDESPCALTAEADGVITSVVVRKGLPLVKAGDTVEKGQMLVTGCIPITDDGGTVVAEHYVHADADVTAVRSRTESETISLWHTLEPLTGKRRKGLSVYIGAGERSAHFVWLLPDLWNTRWKTVTNYRAVRLFGDFYLPVRLGVIDSFEVAPYEGKYTETELSAMAEQYKNRVAENLMEKGVHIIENNVKILVNGSVCRFEVTLQTEESITEETRYEDQDEQGEQQINEHN